VSVDRRISTLLCGLTSRARPLEAALLGCARYGAAAEIVLMLVNAWWSGAAGRRALWRSLAAVGAIYGFVEVGGLLVRRRRPFAAEAQIEGLVSHAPDRSFPSRHSASAIAMALVAWPASPERALAMGVLAAGIGLGRIRAGLHYPSDVLAGSALGGIVGRVMR
jgi:membrane-associated phospholipid phosphatase